MTLGAPSGPAHTWRFDGHIAGLGTAEGTRLVLGHWPRSPFGRFADVMVERRDGHRVLLAPSARVAEFVARTYRFDEVRITAVEVRVRGPRWEVAAGPLDLWFDAGGRTVLGHLLRAVPARVARTPWWAHATGPAARLLLPGVRTIGTAGGGLREWYAARDLHRVVASGATWEGTALGDLRPVEPPPRFGFSSTPSAPSLVRVLSTVEER